MDLTIRSGNWSTLAKAASAIRTAVFIEEQNVPPALEMDGLDEHPDTVHFIGFDGEQAIATGRLLGNGKIGRICVLASHRRCGVGLGLLRDIAAVGLIDGAHRQLYLHAQTEATPLYEKAGFIAEGEVFYEANISHRRMVFHADRAASLAAIFGARVHRLNEERLTQEKHFRQHLLLMCGVGKRRVDVLSVNLSREIFSQHITDAISKLARAHPGAQVRILVQDTRDLAASAHPLVSLAQRLPSSIAIKRLSEKPQHAEQGFVIVDQRYLLFFNDERERQGFANYSAKAEAEHQLEAFDRLWQFHSEPDPDLARLSL